MDPKEKKSRFDTKEKRIELVKNLIFKGANLADLRKILVEENQYGLNLNNRNLGTLVRATMKEIYHPKVESMEQRRAWHLFQYQMLWKEANLSSGAGKNLVTVGEKMKLLQAMQELEGVEPGKPKEKEKPVASLKLPDDLKAAMVSSGDFGENDFKQLEQAEPAPAKEKVKKSRQKPDNPEISKEASNG